MSDQRASATGFSDQSGAVSASSDGPSGSPDAIVGAINDISRRAQTLVRDEVELAKAELNVKAKRLGKGVVIGLAAGIFVVIGLLFLLHGLAWLAWYLFFPDEQFFWGYFVVAALLFLVAAVAGFVAQRAIKKGTPPAPTMAIDEAKLIKETVTAPQPQTTAPARTEVGS
jgi:uncharacterized membrane protein